MKKVYVGKIVNFFGIKGELKVLSNFEMAEKVFKKNQTITINDEKHIISSVRFHKNNYLITMDNMDDINLITKYIGFNIFVDYDNLNLLDNEYLISDLIGLPIVDNNVIMGYVTDVYNNDKNPLLKVDDRFYVPMKGNFIIKVDLKNKAINGQNIKELDI